LQQRECWRRGIGGAWKEEEEEEEGRRGQNVNRKEKIFPGVRANWVGHRRSETGAPNWVTVN